MTDQAQHLCARRTVTYSRIGDRVDSKLDIELPPFVKIGALPTVIFMHSGGLTAGSRNDMFCPKWMEDYGLQRSIIFMIYPSTAFDNMKNLMAFLADPSFSEKYIPDGLDATRMALAGQSGGGCQWRARAAGIYAMPHPRALLILYGGGGAMLSDHWLTIKDPHDNPSGAEHVTAATVADLLHVLPVPVAEDPIRIQPNGETLDDGKRLYLHYHSRMQGTMLDYFGEPETLRPLPPSECVAAFPAHLQPALLERNINASFPPTVFIHGTEDEFIPLSASMATQPSP